jgi:hypothetical protein
MQQNVQRPLEFEMPEHVDVAVNTDPLGLPPVATLAPPAMSQLKL